jgi:DNA (cytosine-5)-methyltransferase 1
MTKPLAYYNEFDPKAAAWLRELIRAGLIAPGDVDERSIKDVKADDLANYKQCHFFAGIGGWSYALRLAGWADAAPVWTGSCPCQPYSSAGKQRGNDDDRNLWPDFYRLIAECKPDVVFGEQVEGAIRHGWLDGVSADLEREGYAVGHCVLGAHSVGAPHIRQRLYWVADSGCVVGKRRTSQQRPVIESQGQRHEEGVDDQRGGAVGIVADAGSSERGRRAKPEGQHGAPLHAANRCDAGGLPDAERAPRSAERLDNARERTQGPARDGAVAFEHREGFERLGDTESGGCGVSGDATLARSGRHDLGASWAGREVVVCRDGKARRVAPGVPLLAHGIPGRVAQLRGLGNAIVPQVAAAIIEAYLETNRNASR